MAVEALLGWEASTWSAAAAWLTALVAVVAVIVATNQLREAARLRSQQAQPYVVVQLRPSEAGDEFLELVVANLGATAARDVQIAIEPEPMRSEPTGPEPVLYPTQIPTFVPGQTWATFWDVSIRRQEHLPDLHVATVDFTDPLRKHHRETFTLDWALERQRGAIRVRGQHHQAEAIRDMVKLMKGWNRNSGSSGLTVWTRDGDARSRRTRKLYDKRRRDREHSPLRRLLMRLPGR